MAPPPDAISPYSLRVDMGSDRRLSCISLPSNEKAESILTATAVEEPSSPLEKKLEDLFLEEDIDGGWRAWLTVLGAFLALMCTFGQLNSFGTFQSWYSDHQLSHLAPSTISWIGSAQLWVFFVSGGVVGHVFDSYGPQVVMVPGTALLVASIMVTSVCEAYYQYILVQGVLFGLGVGMVFYPSLSAISTLFKKYRATALGVALAGSGLGGVVYPIMLRRLFQLVGFAWATRISAFLCLVACGIACLTVSYRPNKHTSSWFSPKSFSDTRYLLLIVACAFISLGLFIPNFYIVSYSIDHNISSDVSFYVLSILNAGGVVGRILPPFLSDKFGRFNMLVPCVFLTGLSTLTLWMFARSLPLIAIYAVTYGFFSGAFNALIMPCIAQVSDIGEIGTRIGMLYSILAFPSLAGGPAAGALIKLEHGSYTGMIALSGATIIVGGFFSLWARLRVNPKILVRA